MRKGENKEFGDLPWHCIQSQLPKDKKYSWVLFSKPVFLLNLKGWCVLPKVLPIEEFPFVSDTSDVISSCRCMIWSNIALSSASVGKAGVSSYLIDHSVCTLENSLSIPKADHNEMR